MTRCRRLPAVRRMIMNDRFAILQKPCEHGNLTPLSPVREGANHVASAVGTDIWQV